VTDRDPPRLEKAPRRVVARRLPSGAAVSKYDPELHPRTVKFLASRGATNVEMADALGITTVTLWNWANKHPEFGDAISQGKLEMFDPKVERSLAERALGYYVDVEELKVIGDEPVIVTVRKYFPPDVTAIIFFLKNRLGYKWRDVQERRIVGDLKSSEEWLVEVQKDILELQAGRLIDGLPATVPQRGNGKKRNGGVD
jgi:transposase-like protein